MRDRRVLVVTAALLLGTLDLTRGQRHLNPVIDLLAAHKPVFGVYGPRNPRARPGAQPVSDTVKVKAPAELAKDALGYANADFLFDGSMEGDYDRAFPVFAEFAKGIADAGGGMIEKSGAAHFHHPLVVKMHEIAPDPATAAQHIADQLDLGVSGVVFVGVESPDEVRAGLAAMRFKSKGGTRPDKVGSAPASWGVSEKEYKEKADLWPLNPKGELVNFTIVESKAGLARVREIAAVKGIGVLFPGAGTLRGVFTTTDANGQRTFDEKGWEAAIQQVLAACKEFSVPCGYPATANDIEMRMSQGFSVFIMNWGDQGFKAVDIGRRVGNRE
jgi:4-hydroxy-2-oxoheptanedioate aldolase